MFIVEKQIYIDRLPQDVFEFSVDHNNAQLWREGVVLAEVTSASMGVGATTREVLLFMGREMEITFEITAYDPPYQFGARTTSGPLDFHVVWTYEPDGGGTLMRYLLEGEPGGFFKVAEGMVKRQVDKQLEKELDNLKAVLEG